MQLFALSLVRRLNRLRREHEGQRVDYVCPRLLTRASLAQDTRDLGYGSNRPAFFTGLVDNRQVHLSSHAKNDIEGQ